MSASFIQLKRGDTWSLVAALTDDAGDPVDLTGATASMQLRTRSEAPSATISASVDSGEVSIDAPAGEISIVFPPSATQEVAPTTYEADIEITYLDGTVASTETFFVTVLADVTRT